MEKQKFLPNLLGPAFRIYSFYLLALGVIGITCAALGAPSFVYGIITVATLAFQAATFYYNREIIGFLYNSKSTKLGEDHELTKTVRGLVKEHSDLYPNLDKIEVLEYKDQSKNAFACGFFKEKSAIYVSTSLIETLKTDDKDKYNNRKLKAVIAHELGHITGSHIFITGLTQVLGTLITMCSYIVWNYAFYGKRTEQKEEKTSDKKEQKNQGPSTLALLGIWAGLKLFSSLGLSYISRQLEYEADATATKAGYGPDLIEALSKLREVTPPQTKGAKIGLYLSDSLHSHPNIVSRAHAIERQLEFVESKNTTQNIAKTIKMSAYDVLDVQTSYFKDEKDVPSMVERIKKRQGEITTSRGI